MTSSTDLYGWDFLYRSVEKDLKSKPDILVAFVHWYLTKNAFKCIGIGQDTNFEENARGEDHLPLNWNSESIYSLRYLKEKNLYILKVLISDKDIIINLLKVNDLNVSCIVFEIEDEVKNIKGSVEEILPNYQIIISKIKNELVGPFVIKPSSESPAKFPEVRKIHQDIRTWSTEEIVHYINEKRKQDRCRDEERFVEDLRTNPLRGVGRTDLDPFAHGSGMIYDPFQRRIPQPMRDLGRIPGARFDPPGPFPNLGFPGRGGPGPDNDHLPPPGYDDMFM